MFARKKSSPPKSRKHDLSQFGLTDIPDDFDPSGGMGDDDDAADSDLEAELAALSGGGASRPKPKPKPKLVAASDLDRMVADSLRDIGSDEEMSGDENDPDLLGELQDIADDGDEVVLAAESSDDVAAPEKEEPQQLFLPTTTIDTISVLKERIDMYTQAEDNAKTSGEAAKARRFNRGLKTLKDLLKQASSGKQINVDDIPPEVGVKISSKPESASDEKQSTPPDTVVPKVPTRSAPPLPTQVPSEQSTDNFKLTPASSDDPKAAILNQLLSRQKEYKIAALNYKRAGDTATALQFIKVVKQFDIVMKMTQDGQEVDLSDMPPPPGEFLEFLAKMQASAEVPPPAAVPVPSTVEVISPSSDDSTKTTQISMLEELQQRLEKCKSVADAAKTEGNASKARRWGRIVKQYEDAMKLYKAGRPVPYDELPAPPGFGPLSGGGNESNTASLPPSATPVAQNIDSSTPTSPAASDENSSNSPPKAEPKKSPQKEELTVRTTGNHQTNNLVEQQMKMLLDRQKEFKVAAIQAKKAGEIDQAKEYLKIYKGFDVLLNAASGGLPIDLTTLPVPPSQRDNLEASFAIVSSDDCDPDEDISDIGVRMEEQLAKQLMMCKNTRDHHKAMGDIAGMNRFENLALTVQKDLDLIRYSKRKNFPLPKFHYENKSFNIVHCNTDLTDNEMEIIVVRGINYKVTNPKDVDTYVRIEVPLLNDEVFKTKTSVVKNTDSPDYDQRFKVDIIRGNRQFQRIFKRHGVKFEIYSRGGFLRSDVLLGTVNVKLQPLETKCDIHDTYDLMEGRKAVGGKLEVKIRVRNPILTKQVEHIDEKWLVLDS